MTEEPRNTGPGEKPRTGSVTLTREQVEAMKEQARREALSDGGETGGKKDAGESIRTIGEEISNIRSRVAESIWRAMFAIDTTLNKQPKFQKSFPFVRFDDIKDEEREKTWAYKLYKNGVFVGADIAATLAAVGACAVPYIMPETFGSLANPQHMVKIRAALNVWFVTTGLISARALGTKEIFSPVSGINFAAILNFGLPAIFAVELIHDEQMMEDLTAIGNDTTNDPHDHANMMKFSINEHGEAIETPPSQLQGTDHEMSTEQARAARVGRTTRAMRGLRGLRILRAMKSARGAIRVTAAIQKIRDRYKDVTQKGLEEVQTEEVISQSIILFALFLMLALGVNLEDPTNHGEAMAYLAKIGAFVAVLIGAEQFITAKINKVVFEPINRIIEQIREEAMTNPKIKRRILDAFNKPRETYKKIDIISRKFLDLMGAVGKTTDPIDAHVNDEYEIGDFEQTMVTTDVNECTRFMALMPTKSAVRILNEMYFRKLSQVLQFGPEYERVFENDPDPRAVLNFYKFVGDATLMSQLAGQEPEIIRNVIAAIWETRKMLHGTKVAIHTDTVNQVILEGGKNIKQPDIMGDGVNMLHRVIELNKGYGTTILMSEETYQLLPEEVQSQFFFVDSVTPIGGEKKINIYAFGIVYMPATEMSVPEKMESENPLDPNEEVVEKSAEEQIKNVPESCRDEVRKKMGELEEAFISMNDERVFEILAELRNDERLKGTMNWTEGLERYMRDRGEFQMIPEKVIPIVKKRSEMFRIAYTGQGMPLYEYLKERIGNDKALSLVTASRRKIAENPEDAAAEIIGKLYSQGAREAVGDEQETGNRIRELVGKVHVDFDLAREILTEVVNDEILRIYMPWATNVLGYLKDIPQIPQDWRKNARRMTSKSGKSKL